MTSLTINTGHNLTKGSTSRFHQLILVRRRDRSDLTFFSALWPVVRIGQDEAWIRFRDHIRIIHAPDMFLAGTCIDDVYTTHSGEN